MGEPRRPWRRSTDRPWSGTVPEPALRAALLLLRGTSGDTVIEAVAAGVFAGVAFTQPVADLPRASILPPAPQARPTLAINGLLRFEDPRLVAPLLLEAALHEDAVRTPKENLVGQALLPLIHGQLVLETPSLVKTGTLLARQLNGLLLGRLNSRDLEGRLRLTASRGNIFPGSVANVGSYLGIFIPFGPDTPGSRGLWDVITAVTGDATFEGPFSVATIRLLEDRQALWSAEQIVTLLRVLETNVP